MGQAHQQILDDIGDGIGGDGVRTQMSHDHGVHGETTSPHQFIAKHRQAVFPEILLQRPIGMQHMAKSQVGATTGRHDRPCQLNRTRNHRGYSRAENAKRGNAEAADTVNQRRVQHDVHDHANRADRHAHHRGTGVLH